MMTSSARSMSRTLLSRSVDSSTSPSGICPPTRPVLPPWGISGVRVSLHRPHDGGDLGRRSGQQQDRRLAAPALAPFDQFGGETIRILAPAALAEQGLQPVDDAGCHGRGHGLGRTAFQPIRPAARRRRSLIASPRPVVGDWGRRRWPMGNLPGLGGAQHGEQVGGRLARVVPEGLRLNTGARSARARARRPGIGLMPWRQDRRRRGGPARRGRSATTSGRASGGASAAASASGPTTASRSAQVTAPGRSRRTGPASTEDHGRIPGQSDRVRHRAEHRRRAQSPPPRRRRSSDWAGPSGWPKGRRLADGTGPSTSRARGGPARARRRCRDRRCRPRSQTAVRFGDGGDQGERPRLELVAPGRGARSSSTADPPSGRQVWHMGDQRIEPGPAFGLIDLGHRLGVGGVGRQAVDSLGGQDGEDQLGLAKRPRPALCDRSSEGPPTDSRPRRPGILRPPRC